MPCNEMGNEKKSRGKLKAADEIARASLRAISDSKAPVWFLENPHTQLYQRPFMQALDALRAPCTYCMYGTDYKKQTDIWTNIPLALHHCDHPDNCCRCIAQYGHHLRTAQQGPSTTSDGFTVPGISAREANSVPPALLKYLIDTALPYTQTQRSNNLNALCVLTDT